MFAWRENSETVSCDSHGDFQIAFVTVASAWSIAVIVRYRIGLPHFQWTPNNAANSPVNRVHQIWGSPVHSPSDVAEERKCICEVVAAWNAVHSRDKATVLDPVSWESHASPEMGERPQGIINKRLLKDCDLLIAVFGTRIGSPTGKAISGTVEEIEEHIATEKPAMIYFLQSHVRHDNVDLEQYEELKKFRSSCELRGLCETYKSISEFREKLSRQLAITMIRLTADAKSTAAEIAIATKAVESQVPPRISISFSPNAQQILKITSQDKHGQFLRLNALSGLIFQANEKQLNTNRDARDNAKWDAALEELENAGYIKSSGIKREIFKLTSDGYEAADHIAT